MTISLGGVILPDMMQTSRHEKGVISVVRRALDDTAIVWEGQAKNHIFSLYGTAQRATVTKAQLDQLWALANVPRAKYPLIYGGVESMVRFRNEEWPPIESTPIQDRSIPEATDRYQIEIKLMKIG